MVINWDIKFVKENIIDEIENGPLEIKLLSENTLLVLKFGLDCI